MEALLPTPEDGNSPSSHVSAAVDCTLDGVGVCVLEATALESLTVVSVDDGVDVDGPVSVDDDVVVDDGLGCVVVESDSDDVRSARLQVARVRGPVRDWIRTIWTFTTGIPTVVVCCASVVERAELDDEESDSVSVTTVVLTTLLSTARALSLASATGSKLCGASGRLS